MCFTLAGCAAHRPASGSAAPTVLQCREQVAKVYSVVSKLLAVVPPQTCRRYVIVESAVPNASMDRRGELRITTGLLQFAETDDQLAYVLAHEMAHAVLHHPRRLRVYGVLQLLVTAAVVAVAGDAGEAALAGAGVFFTTSLSGTLPAMRRMEKEADALALDVMRRAGFDVKAAAEFWRRYAAVRPPRPLPRWLSAHPDDAARVRMLAQPHPD